MPFAIEAKHKHLGTVYITQQCFDLQHVHGVSENIFIYHDGEVKEVTKSLVEPVQLTWFKEGEI